MHERIEDEEKVIIRATKRWAIFMSITILFGVMVIIGIVDSGQVLTTSLYLALGGILFYFIDRSRIKTELKRFGINLVTITGKYFSISNPKTYTITKPSEPEPAPIVEAVTFEQEEVPG